MKFYAVPSKTACQDIATKIIEPALQAGKIAWLSDVVSISNCPVTQIDSSINTVNSYSLETGTKVLIPETNNGIYFLIKISATTYKLAATTSDAESAEFINLADFPASITLVEQQPDQDTLLESESLLQRENSRFSLDNIGASNTYNNLNSRGFFSANYSFTPNLNHRSIAYLLGENITNTAKDKTAIDAALITSQLAVRSQSASPVTVAIDRRINASEESMRANRINQYWKGGWIFKESRINTTPYYLMISTLDDPLFTYFIGLGADFTWVTDWNGDPVDCIVNGVFSSQAATTADLITGGTISVGATIDLSSRKYWVNPTRSLAILSSPPIAVAPGAIKLFNNLALTSTTIAAFYPEITELQQPRI